MSERDEQIRKALSEMDALDDEQWTTDGAPKVDFIADAANLKELKRAEIINAAPKFNRDNFDLEFEAEEPEAEEEAPIEGNSLGLQHPEIVAAQKRYDDAAVALGKARTEERESSKALGEVLDRLMRKTPDKHANQRSIMQVIKRSTQARQQRMENFQKQQAILGVSPTKSPLDKAISGTKKVKQKM